MFCFNLPNTIEFISLLRTKRDNYNLKALGLVLGMPT